jgi:DNA processing protein
MSFPTFSQREARLLFSHLPNIGPILCDRLNQAFKGDLAQALFAPSETLLSIQGIGKVLAETIFNWRKCVDLPKIQAALQKANTTFLIPEDEGYPELLKEIPDAPIGLYVKGNTPPQVPSIAIVGSRRATLYGRGIAEKFSHKLAEKGFAIVSGMARGIDGSAHTGALQAQGATVAVLGTGVDLIYPPEHADLYKKIVEQGTVLSEFPLSRPADRQTFPMRNRIIAGMCYATIVVESDSNGGSMITARLAGEMGRTVFAIPGRIDQVSSRGCHALIREGATLLTDIEEVIEDLAPIIQKRLPLTFGKQTELFAAPWEPQADLSDFDNTLLKTLFEKGPSSLDELADTLESPIHRISSSLMQLEIKKHLAKKMDGRFEACSLGY